MGGGHRGTQHSPTIAFRTWQLAPDADADALGADPLTRLPALGARFTTATCPRADYWIVSGLVPAGGKTASATFSSHDRKLNLELTADANSPSAPPVSASRTTRADATCPAKVVTAAGITPRSTRG